MKKKIRLCLTSVFALGSVILGCDRHVETAMTTKKGEAQTEASSVEVFKIWQDVEAGNVIAALGQQATVYRWENGVLDGWVQFDSDVEPQKVPLNFGQLLYKQVAEHEAKLPAFDRFYGMLIVTSKLSNQESDEFIWRDYSIHIQTGWKSTKSGSSTITNGPIHGRVKFLKGRAVTKNNDETQVESQDTGKGNPTIQFASEAGGETPCSSSSENVITFAKKISTTADEERPWLLLKYIEPTKDDQLQE